MSQTAYGRGRSRLGLTHLEEPGYKYQPLCGNGCPRTYAFGAEGRRLVECKTCQKMYDKHPSHVVTKAKIEEIRLLFVAKNYESVIQEVTIERAKMIAARIWEVEKGVDRTAIKERLNYYQAASRSAQSLARKLLGTES